MDLTLILLIVISGLILITCLIFIILLAKIGKKLDSFRSLIDESNVLKNYLQEKSLEDKKLEYSKNVMEFGRNLAAQSSIMMFHEYIDNHQVDKLTRIQLSELIKDISTSINISIDYTQIDFNRTIFTREYFQRFIVNTVVNSTKSLFNKYLDENY